MAAVTGSRRYVVDRDVIRRGDRVAGGSPLRTFVLSEAGQRTMSALERGEPVERTELVDRLLAAGVIHPVPSGRPRRGVPGREWAEVVTIVTPAFGRPDRVAPGSILVDDGSAPPIPGARVRLDRNRGPGAARNAGLGLVTTPFVAFVDTDVDLPTGWLAGLMPHFDDPDVVLVAPRVRSRAGPSRLERYERRHSPLDLGRRPANVGPGRLTSYVPTAAVVARTDAVRRVGGFDEDLRFGEDVDLVWRLVDAGGVVRYEPGTIVVHPPRTSWRSWCRQRIDYGGSAAALARRHPDRLAPWHGRLGTVAPWWLIARGRVVVGVAATIATQAWQTAWVRRSTGLPAADAARLVTAFASATASATARAVRRGWWPMLAVAATRSPTTRRVLLVSAVAAVGPVRLADDVAYSIGVWRGVVAHRTIRPLVPSIAGMGRHVPADRERAG